MGDEPLGEIEDKGTWRNNRWYGVMWWYYLIYLFNENMVVLIRSNSSKTWSIGSTDSLLALLAYIHHTYIFCTSCIHHSYLQPCTYVECIGI